MKSDRHGDGQHECGATTHARGLEDRIRTAMGIAAGQDLPEKQLPTIADI